MKKKIDILKGNEISQSVPVLINDHIASVFTGLRTDIRTHPTILTLDGEDISGIDAVAYRLGLTPGTIRSKWNPGTERTIKMDEFMEWSYVLHPVNWLNAYNVSLYMFGRKHQEELKQRHARTQKKLDEIKAQIGAVK